MRRHHRLVSVALALVAVALFTLVVPSTASGGVFTRSVASGDPRPDSVVLWTRLDNPAMPDALRVDVATDETFDAVVVTRSLVAEAEHDYCVKLRVDGLEPGTTYYYRFVYGSGAALEVSPIGRTRTAPAADSANPVRFAVVYGQDFVGRYYNAYAELLRDHDADLDFVVHLGDYVYETTGDPTFQDPTSERRVVFDDTAGAIMLGDLASPYYAASSLANYRTLYRTFRSDPMLQQVHERWPMVVVWDDHEYSNDCHGAVATYTNGRSDEDDADRRRRSEQAFYEWIPTEVGLGADGALETGTDVLYPNATIYRDLRFGSVLDLVMTDYRSFRPDHLIAEDAFPGAIVLDRETLEQALSPAGYAAVAPSLDPYVDIDALAAFVPILRQTATLIAAQAYALENPALDLQQAVAVASQAMHGEISATYLNLLFEAAGFTPPLTEAFLAGLPRGLSYLYLGKQSLYSSTGSRYLVLHDPYQLLSGVLYQATAGMSEDAFGPLQDAWMQGVLSSSDASWKVLASSVSMTPMVIDFSNPQLAALLPPEFPDVLRTRLTINVDQWDGFPHRRAQILGTLATVPNSVVISGDIHSWFVTDHGAGVYELTAPAISSESLEGMVLGEVSRNPLLATVPGIETLVSFLGDFLQLSSLDDVNVSPSDILATDTHSNGYMVVEATPEALEVEIVSLPDTSASTSYYDQPDALDDLAERTTFTISGGVLTPGG